MQRLVEQRGLRAQLRSGNLLTGQLYVAFDFFPNAPKAKIDWTQDMPELPVVQSTVADLEGKVTGIVAKLDKLPYEAIGADLTKVLVSLNQTLEDASKAVNRVDADVTPELKMIVSGTPSHDCVRRRFVQIAPTRPCSAQRCAGAAGPA